MFKIDIFAHILPEKYLELYRKKCPKIANEVELGNRAVINLETRLRLMNRYPDVLEVHYWGRYPQASSREVYHLGNGLGTIRFESFNSQEPSGVHLQYAERFEPFTPTDRPALPWFDPKLLGTRSRLAARPGQLNWPAAMVFRNPAAC